VISKSPPLTPKVVPAVEAAILISPPSNFSERLEFSPTAVVSTPVFVALAGWRRCHHPSSWRSGSHPFNVGDASKNGTGGAIVSTGGPSILPFQSLPYTYSNGVNINIISVPSPPPTPPTVDPPTPPTQPSPQPSTTFPNRHYLMHHPPYSRQHHHRHCLLS
jgi:hypothetical protein